MANVRRLPEPPQKQLERLARDNWRTQVSTGTVQGGAEAEASLSDTLADIVDRLGALEQWRIELEGVETSG